MRPLREWPHEVEPRYCPPRDPRYLSEGEAITRVARLMGIEPMPHQRRVYDIATQYRIVDGARRYKYRTVLVTIPRQSGKTTLLGPWLAYRAMSMRDKKMWTTAQTGSAATARMKDIIKTLRLSPLKELFSYTLSNGSTGFRCDASGTAVQMFAPVDGAVHGETTVLAAYDEIWKWSEDQGENVDAAIRPSMITQGGLAQKIMTSTVGTASSTYMNPLIDAGRAGTDPALCYIEYGAHDLDLDPLDPASWWEFHPAIGNTITEAALLDERASMAPHEFVRAYANILSGASDPIIGDAVWAAQGAPDVHDLAAADAIRVAVEVAPDNACASIVAAWRQVGFDRPCARVVHRAPGTHWIPTALSQLLDDLDRLDVPVTVHADGAGPVRRIVADWNGNAAAVRAIRSLNAAMFGAACENFIAIARDGVGVAHDATELLAAEVQGAVMRTYNGVSMLSRDKSPVPIPSLIALTVAVYALDHPDDKPEELPPLILV